MCLFYWEYTLFIVVDNNQAKASGIDKTVTTGKGFIKRERYIY